jgi:hypothetical protein
MRWVLARFARKIERCPFTGAHIQINASTAEKESQSGIIIT